MAFNINSWSTVSSSANLDVGLLQDGSYVGTPSNHTYIHAVDTLATIAAANYFNTVAGELHEYDRIYVIGSDGIADMRVTSVTFNPTAVSTTTDLGLGDVNGPAVATDNAVTRFDGITGKVIQNSGVILSDADALTGITSLTVDNINVNGNTIISTDVNGNINLTPNGVGINVLANAQVTGLTASRAVVTDASKNLTSATTTATEIGYVNGVTSAIQTQIDNLIAATYKVDINQVTHGLAAGNIVYSNAGVYTKAKADAVATADVVGIVIAVADPDNFTLQFSGVVSAGLAALTNGAIQYLSPGTAGALTITKPTTAGQVIKPVMIATSATTAIWWNQLGVLI